MSVLVPSAARKACAALLVACAMLGGCMTRTGLITSEPAGARVIVNEIDIGKTPCEFEFTYYGTYDALLTLDGYEPQRVAMKFAQPWYEFPPLDIAANALPSMKSGGRPGVHTIRREHVVLVPTPAVDAASEAGLLERARELRQRASSSENAK